MRTLPESCLSVAFRRNLNPLPIKEEGSYGEIIGNCGVTCQG